MEASVTHLVRRALDCWRPGFHRGCRRKLYRTGGSVRQSTLALPVRRFRLLLTHGVRDRRQRVRCRRGGVGAVHVRAAVSMSIAVSAYIAAETITFRRSTYLLAP